MKKRLVVGLTGTFGSGKSSVGRILAELGARRVIDCDRLVHEAFRARHPLKKRIELLFGSSGLGTAGRSHVKFFETCTNGDVSKRFSIRMCGEGSGES